MNLRNVHVPQFIKFTYSLMELENLLVETLRKRNTRLPAIICDVILYEKPELINFRTVLEQAWGKYLIYRCGSARVEFAQEIQRELIAAGSDIVIAIGGGKTLDVGKYVAAQNALPFISVPTQVSHDGIASPVAVLSMDEHSYSLGARTPMAVFIDVPTIRATPPERLRAGIGDLISNLTAVSDWRLAAVHNQESIDDFAALLSEFAAHSIFYHSHPDLESNRFVEDVIKALVLSGIAMEIAGNSKPCSGAEHLISHSIDSFFPQRSHFHGEQVAFGTIIAAFLHNMEWQKIRDYFQTLGLPVKVRELGFSPEEMITIIQKAPNTRPQRFTIFNTIDLSPHNIRRILDDVGALS